MYTYLLIHLFISMATYDILAVGTKFHLYQNLGKYYKPPDPCMDSYSSLCELLYLCHRSWSKESNQTSNSTLLGKGKRCNNWINIHFKNYLLARISHSFALSNFFELNMAKLKWCTRNGHLMSIVNSISLFVSDFKSSRNIMYLILSVIADTNYEIKLTNQIEKR